MAGARFRSCDFQARVVALTHVERGGVYGLRQAARDLVSGTARRVAILLLLAGATPVRAAYDDAADPAYADGWQTGDNGGTGFGPWTLRGGSNEFFFIGSTRYNG